ncbi:hypothetical protein C0W92_00055 [Photobacterium angustum]|uniref:Uncharacterized protein n=1 Tax=Photobacterium angustum TaxID=661 RepID=A0A855SEF8_PHOAN|nr:hypothetical protein [Photobacterium angustum]KJF83155.1 hypothetical protein UB36_00740 [Photobacterium damselae subsp. damselae]KJG29182.1 hypothetical protein UA69_15080 [Photobacterium angustum]KJG43002.1 hypothetical protein UA35_03300 [Photobacterium angustum]KJG47463.1 hypothetical protein UA31_00740 [Photobacterium angustum]KJG49294.1 hypothetical protein UA30_08905 [Photobacterium angustum]
MEATVLEFHLEYNPNRKNPAEVFHAMGNFISAYQEMGQIIAEAVDSEMIFDVELQEVTHGSILAKLLLKVEEWTRPDDLFRELTGEMSQKEQVQHVTNKERIRLKKEMHKRGRSNPLDPYISDLDVALVAEKWSEGNKKLMPDEYLKVCNEGTELAEVIPFDPNFRFTGNVKKMFSSDQGHFDGEEIVEVFKPCKKATSKWEVISTRTNKRYCAEICHKKWLEDYLNSEIRLGGSDYLRVHAEYDVVVEKGEERIKNAKIKEIKEVITYRGTQNEIPT